jgi:replicative DNA helicase
MPGMHQLRESGNIEADADVIFLMSRDKNDVRETPDTTKLMLAKNRKGETGLTTIHFNKITTRFDE